MKPTILEDLQTFYDTHSPSMTEDELAVYDQLQTLIEQRVEGERTWEAADYNAPAYVEARAQEPNAEAWK